MQAGDEHARHLSQANPATRATPGITVNASENNQSNACGGSGPDRVVKVRLAGRMKQPGPSAG